MRTALAAFALVLVPAAAAAPPFGSQWATAVADPARPPHTSALTVTLHYPMTCGQPGRGPVVVTLPTAVTRLLATHRPSSSPGKTPPSLGFFGRTVTIGLPKPPDIICQSIAQGTLRVRFTAAAGLTNPARAGSYTVTARIGNRTFATQARNSLSANDGGPAMPALRGRRSGPRYGRAIVNDGLVNVSQSASFAGLPSGFSTLILSM